MKVPIIICGMAHSGTTALAAYLGSAPRWRNYVSGKEASRLECQELLYREAAPLRALLAAHPRTRFVLKRPWAELSCEWLLQEFPDACYLVSLRSFDRLWESWNKEDSAAMRGLKDGTPEHAWWIWQTHMSAAAKLVARAQRAAFIDHAAFCRRPTLVDEILKTWDLLPNSAPSPFSRLPELSRGL